MTLEEAKKAIDGLKADGLTEEEIAVVLHDMYRDDKITAEEFGELVGLVGYELTEEFYNMSEEERKERLYDEVDEDYLGRKKKTYKLEFRKVAYDRIKEMMIEFKEEKVYDKYVILDMCFMLYKFDYITRNEFKELCESINFELNEDFLNKSVKDQKEFIDSVYNMSSKDFQEKKEFLYDVFGDALDKLQIVKNNTFVYNNQDDTNS